MLLNKWQAIGLVIMQRRVPPLLVIVWHYSLSVRALPNNHVTVWTLVTGSTHSAWSSGEACHLASSVLTDKQTCTCQRSCDLARIAPKYCTENQCLQQNKWQCF